MSHKDHEKHLDEHVPGWRGMTPMEVRQAIWRVYPTLRGGLRYAYRQVQVGEPQATIHPDLQDLHRDVQAEADQPAE